MARTFELEQAMLSKMGPSQRLTCGCCLVRGNQARDDKWIVDSRSGVRSSC